MDDIVTPVMPTAHRIQKSYAEYIKRECMTGDREVDQKKAKKAVIKYLECIGCDGLAEAYKAVARERPSNIPGATKGGDESG